MVDLKPELEKFYAGTTYYMGSPATSGNRTTPSGATVPTPSTSEYLTKEGWWIPRANQVIFIVDGKEVGMSVEQKTVEGLTTGAITPQDVFYGATRATATPSPQPTTQYIPSMPNPFTQPRQYAKLGTLTNDVITRQPTVFEGGQTTAEVLQSPQNLNVISRISDMFTMTDTIPFNYPAQQGDFLYSKPTPNRNVVGRYMDWSSRVTGYGQEPLPNIISVNRTDLPITEGKYTKRHTPASQFVDLPSYQYGQQTESQVEFLPTNRVGINEYLSISGRARSSFGAGLLNAIPSIFLQSPNLPYAVTKSEEDIYLLGGIVGDIAGDELFKFATKSVTSFLRRKGILAPQEYDIEALIGITQTESVTETTLDQFNKLGASKQTIVDSDISSNYVKYRAKQIEYVIPDQLQFSYLRGEFKAPIIPDDWLTPAVSETLLDVGKGAWNIDTGFSFKSLEKGIKTSDIILIQEGTPAIDSMLKGKNALGQTYKKGIREYKAVGTGGFIDDISGTFKPAYTIYDDVIRYEPSKRISLLSNLPADTPTLTNLNIRWDNGLKLNLYDTWATSRKDVLRHELIHVLNPDWSETAVIKAEYSSRELPITKEVIWSANVKKASRFTYMNFQGVYPDLNLGADIGNSPVLKFKGTGQGQDSVLEFLQKSYKTDINLVDKVEKAKVFSGSLDIAGTKIDLSKVTGTKSGLEKASNWWPYNSIPSALDDTLYISPKISAQFDQPTPQFKTSTTTIGLLDSGKKNRIIQTIIPKTKPKQDRLQITGSLNINKNKQVLGQELNRKLDRLQLSSQITKSERIQKNATSLKLNEFQQFTQKTPYDRNTPIPTIIPLGSKKGSTARSRSKVSLGNFRVGNIRMKTPRRSPRSDPLSVEMTAGSLLSKGKRPIPTLLSGKKAAGYFRRSGGFRVPTVEMLGNIRKKSKKGRKNSKRRGWF